MRNEIEIVIGADLVPTSNNYSLFENGDVDKLIGDDLHHEFEHADFVILNLETPITDTVHPIAKCGPCLSAPSNVIKGIAAINSHFFTLANNHIMDQGIEGLHSTEYLLNEYGISYAGVGNNLELARQGYIKQFSNFKLGIYCCAEHEFSAATLTTPGTNVYDPLYTFDDIKKLKQQCDKIIVLYHGGKEHYQYPSPQMQRVFRKMSEYGADCIIAQHSHCIGAMEYYNDSLLIYGQGNFLFNKNKNELWKTGIIVKLIFNIENNALTYDFLPIEMTASGIRLSKGQKKDVVLQAFEDRSKAVNDIITLEEKYKEFARNNLNGYLDRFRGMRGNSIITKIFDRITNYYFLHRNYSDIYGLSILNVIECEAHRELCIAAIKESADKV